MVYMFTYIKRHPWYHSIMVSIPVCHAGDRGSIPRDTASSRPKVGKLTVNQ